MACLMVVGTEEAGVPASSISSTDCLACKDEIGPCLDRCSREVRGGVKRSTCRVKCHRRLGGVVRLRLQEECLGRGPARLAADNKPSGNKPSRPMADRLTRPTPTPPVPTPPTPTAPTPTSSGPRERPVSASPSMVECAVPADKMTEFEALTDDNQRVNADKVTDVTLEHMSDVFGAECAQGDKTDFTGVSAPIANLRLAIQMTPAPMTTIEYEVSVTSDVDNSTEAPDQAKVDAPTGDRALGRGTPGSPALVASVGAWGRKRPRPIHSGPPAKQPM